MKPLDVLHLQLRLEGLEVIHGNLLKQVEIVPGEDMPLFLLAYTADRQLVVFYDASLPPHLYQGLAERIEGMNFPELDPLPGYLKNQNITFDMGHYKTYVFPEHITTLMKEAVFSFSKSDPRVAAFGFGGFAEQVYGIERLGRIVSACVSTRENAQCGEAWVYTDPQYRHHGFAQHVVCAWAQNMLRAGKVPLYSHKIDNIASANLAKQLGLQFVFEEIAISPA